MQAADSMAVNSATSFWDTIGFMPHGHCFLWRSDILFTHVGSDLLIALSYFSIPLCLFYFVSKKPNMGFHWLFIMFGIFITGCGLTHLLSIVTFWYPIYGISGIFKAITAVVSFATAIVLWKVLPRALELRSPEELRVLNEELLKEQKSLEEKVKQRTSKLEETVEQLIGEISKREEVECELINAKLTAERSSMFKSQFLANMSHEIRTPLSLILGFTEEIAEGAVNNKDSKELANLVKKNGEILNKVISDILDISKIEAGKLEFSLTTIYTEDLSDDLYAMFSPKAEERGLRFEVVISDGFPQYFKTDELRLKQILINVIGNAFKYTDSGKILIKLSMENENLIFDVIDTGRGILKDDTERIFEAFVQSKENSALLGGTGLGLTISKTIAVGLKGNIELVNSEQNLGSHFRIKIKNQIDCITEFSHSRSNKKVPLDLSGLSILIVDDLEDNLKLLEVILKPTKAKCGFAMSAKEAFKKLEEDHFDLILMDLQMPDINGYEAFKMIRNLNYFMPIWAVSAYAMKDDIKKCKEMGFEEHVAKPINRSVLYSKLAYWKHVNTARSINKAIESTRRDVYRDLELN